MKLSGAEIVLACLKEQGVDKIFGYPGGAVIPLYDALYHQSEHFNHILTCHEQGAVHAADGYARSTGKVGVCFATSGPGATNTVTGIATAYMDSVPLVLITGQVSTDLLGKDSFQEVDITGITLPITKYNYFVRNIEELEGIMHEAFKIAKSDRPGPVLIDIPKNIFIQKTEYGNQRLSKEKEKKEELDGEKLQKGVELIAISNKPVIYAGGGIILSNASQELYALAVKGNIPVVNTLMGLGSFPREHSLSLGLVGMHGLKPANMAISNSDLVIAIGARFSDRVIGRVEEFAPKAKIIHIDIDKSEIGKNKGVDLSILGDVKNILSHMTQCIRKVDRGEWLREIRQWDKEKKENEEEWIVKNIIRRAWKVLGTDTIVTTEVGQHQMWTAQEWKFKKARTFLSSGGLGTMGYGLGAAIGAQIGNPHEKILHIAGDGSFRMNCNELATVSKYRLPIITLLINNQTLGMVRQWQKLFCDERYSQTDITGEVDYIKLAQAYGIEGKRVGCMKVLEEVLEETVEKRRPIVIECSVSKEECVYPMVPPGEPIHHMILEE